MSEQDEVKDEVVQEQEGDVQSEQQEDRPERNYKAELDRKNREIERLRREADAREHSSVQKRDPSDLATWADHELKAVAKSNDPATLQFRDQAEDLLLERKVKSLREKERMQERRATADIELRTKYPDALDQNSEFASKMEQVMYEYDLHKTPAGKLAAAKIVAAEMGKGRSNKSALERNNEASRVRELKGQMVDGDRSKPSVSSNSPKKLEEAVNKANSKNLNEAAKGFNDVLKGVGISRDSFFK